MILLNFSHPLTDSQRAQVEALVGRSVDQIIQIPVQFDVTQSFIPQTEALVKVIPLTSEVLQTEQLLVVSPALNFITAILLADLHGRMGYFPAILRMRPVTGSTPPAFEVAEIINLQSIRDKSRIFRTET
ncbi:MAG: CRISPR-associated protein Csx15 [Anaerolineaceae bacterium]